MPVAVKPCEGRFSDEVREVLSQNIDRSQWANHTCEVCGLSVGAKQDKGKWVPEQHWPSVKYRPRTVAVKKQSPAAESMAPDESAVFVETGSR